MMMNQLRLAGRKLRRLTKAPSNKQGRQEANDVLDLNQTIAPDSETQPARIPDSRVHAAPPEILAEHADAVQRSRAHLERAMSGRPGLDHYLRQLTERGLVSEPHPDRGERGPAGLGSHD